MHTHPEQTAAEVFLGNTTLARGIPPDLASFKSARMGVQAFSIDGHKLTAADAMAPLFIGRREADAYDRVQMARLSAIRRSY